MSRIAALVAGMFAVAVFSYCFVPASYDPLINWFGPFFGIYLKMARGMIYLALASPLTYPTVFGVWALIGIVVGLFARTMRKALATATLVYTFSLTLLGLEIGALISKIQGSALALGQVPPAPPETNIISILNAPVINTIAPVLLRGVLSAEATTFYPR